MAIPVRSNLDFEGVARIEGLPAAIAAGQPVPFEQFQGAIEGLSWKDNTRVASTGNMNLASPGAAIDGITMTSGDRVLVKDQSFASENGIYIWNGAATPMTRAPDASTFAELESAILFADEGTVNGGKGFRQTAVNGTIGASNITWTSFASTVPAASETTAGIIEIATLAETNTGTDHTRAVTPKDLKDQDFLAKTYSVAVGDGSNTQYTVTHNLNTEFVQVSCREAAGNKRKVIVEDQVVNANSIKLIFLAAPASNSINVTVQGNQA